MDENTDWGCLGSVLRVIAFPIRVWNRFTTRRPGLAGERMSEWTKRERVRDWLRLRRQRLTCRVRGHKPTPSGAFCARCWSVL